MQIKVISALDLEVLSATDGLSHHIGNLRRAVMCGASDRELRFLCHTVVEAENKLTVLRRIVEAKERIMWSKKGGKYEQV